MKIIPNELEIEHLYLMAGESLTICLNRQHARTITLKMQVFPEGGCEVITNDGKAEDRRLWFDTHK